MTNPLNPLLDLTATAGPLLGRLLIAALFIPAGLMKIPGFDATAAYMTLKGLPLVPLLLVLTIVIEAGGGLLLLLGWRAREAALALFLFMIPVTVIFHGFWNVEDAAARLNEQRAFMKNVAITGGLLMVAAFGPGPFSLGRAKPPRA
ncbi:MAG TPA: DoxX family protein [Porticoccaceae bacterium]|nr:DoxX family protein [Porticoccaceae bacterium]